MDIQTEKYGTTGLPKFGPGYSHAGGVAAGDTKQAVEAIDGAFNNLLTVVKKNTIPGNTMLLWLFGVGLKSAYAIAYSCVAEKPVINA